MEHTPQGQPQEGVPPPDMMRVRNLAQIALAKAAFPALEGSAALKQWVLDGLSARFSGYFEDSSHTKELISFDPSDPAAAKELLNKIQGYNQTPESLH